MGNRLVSIDTIRGFAIIVMIFANAYPYLYPFEYCPKILRLLFSSAAPIFIFLSGVSLRLAQENGKKFNYLILRAFQILFFAVIIDSLIWFISPFLTMDVLYLISYSMLLTTCLISVSDKVKLIFAIAIILCIAVTNHYYHFEMTEIPIIDFPFGNYFYQALHHTFIDGWFPILPWMGFFILGYIICKKRLMLMKYSNYLLILGSSFILGFLFFYLFEFVRVNPIRDGYTEIFYPVSIPYLFYVFGLFLVVTFFINKTLTGFSVISSMGKFSLPIYFIHILLIKFYVPFFSQAEDSFNELIFYSGILTLYLLIFVCLYFIKKVKNKNKYVSFFLGVTTPVV